MVWSHIQSKKQGHRRNWRKGEGEEGTRVKDPLPAMNFALVGLKLKEFLESQKLNFSDFLVPKGLKKIKNKWKLFKIS